MQNEPITDIAHLGHLELFTPKPDESVRFFVDIMGMTESGREGDSVLLPKTQCQRRCVSRRCNQQLFLQCSEFEPGYEILWPSGLGHHADEQADYLRHAT